MVARINTGKSISKALNYNEKKVQEGQAEYLSAKNFLKEINEMNFYEKRKTFEKLTALNERTSTNTLHLSLNFDPSENLSNEKLTAIGDSYMEKIGFGGQPYLVYRHHDTGHPHIHIVSTNIKNDGSRISMHKLGATKSEAARKQIEADFNLVKAESKKLAATLQLIPVNAQKLHSGRRSTKAAISNVLGIVIQQYKYGSLGELNAVLKIYNVTADRCGETSETYKHRGLLYRVLDENGKKTGTPIKASLFYIKPTLNNLEKYFTVNELSKQPHAKRIRTAIDYAFIKNPSMHIKELEKTLLKEGISTVVRQNKDGVIYGMTYVDHKSKCVFNGSDLGKHYSAQSIQERCNQPVIRSMKAIGKDFTKTKQTGIVSTQSAEPKAKLSPADMMNVPANTLADALLRAENLYDSIPYQLKRTRRKRQKKRINL